MSIGNIPVGTVVMFINQDKHNEEPGFYPELGTLGTVLKHNSCCIEGYLIQWEPGSTDDDGQWYCGPNDMISIKELDVILKKQGYHLTKYTKPPKIAPCPKCGCTKTEIWYTQNGIRRRCHNCDFQGDVGKNMTDAKRKWNEAVLNYESEESINDKN